MERLGVTRGRDRGKSELTKSFGFMREVESYGRGWELWVRLGVMGEVGMG